MSERKKMLSQIHKNEEKKKWTTQKQSTWQTVKCNQQWKHLKKWKHDKNENIWRNIDEKP